MGDYRVQVTNGTTKDHLVPGHLVERNLPLVTRCGIPVEGDAVACWGDLCVRCRALELRGETDG